MQGRGQSNPGQGPRAGRHSESGLTIIEIVIVFAVGGLMLMIVLIAIPALQRNSRNNQRRQDVQSVLGAVSHWQLNHSGNIPVSSDPYLQDNRTKLTYYDLPDGVLISPYAGSADSPNTISEATDINKVTIYNYQRCSPTGGGSTKTGAGYSDVVALYAIETGSSGVGGKCQQL